MAMDTIPPAADAQNSGSGERFRIRCDAGDDNRFRVATEPRKRRATMRYPEVKGKVIDFIQASAQTEGAFVNIRFTDKTDLGLTFNAKMKLTHASLNDASDGNFELVKEYEVPS